MVQTVSSVITAVGVLVGLISFWRDYRHRRLHAALMIVVERCQDPPNPSFTITNHGSEPIYALYLRTVSATTGHDRSTETIAWGIAGSPEVWTDRKHRLGVLAPGKSVTTPRLQFQRQDGVVVDGAGLDFWPVIEFTDAYWRHWIRKVSFRPRTTPLPDETYSMDDPRWWEVDAFRRKVRRQLRPQKS